MFRMLFTVAAAGVAGWLVAGADSRPAAAVSFSEAPTAAQKQAADAIEPAGRRYYRGPRYGSRWSYGHRYHPRNGWGYGYRYPRYGWGYGYPYRRYYGNRYFYGYGCPWWGCNSVGIGIGLGFGGGYYGGGYYGGYNGGYAYSGRKAHVRWCRNRYRSYDARSDTFMGYDGNRHRCRGPY